MTALNSEDKPEGEKRFNIKTSLMNKNRQHEKKKTNTEKKEGKGRFVTTLSPVTLHPWPS